jgi:acetyl esterase/lipase
VFASFAGLPPLLIQVGSHEVLVDDAARLAAAAARDDADVTLRLTAGAAHVFQNNFGLLGEADQALDDVARFTRRYLS